MSDKNRKKTLTVISLGAGVQSSTMAIMAAKGDFPSVDCAIFADTGNEPKMVYKYLELLKKILPYPVHIVSKGDIMKDMLNAKDNTNFVVAPYFTQNKITGKKGMVMRQCTNDYKIQVITQKVRELLGLKKRERVKKGTKVEMLMGISKDEVFRMKPNRLPYITNVYPLIDLNMRRQNCIDWFNKYYEKTPPRSACIYCPYKGDKEWKHLRENNPNEWQEVIEFDKKIRNNSRKKEIEVYVHRSCKPIGEIDLDIEDNQLDLFQSECEGYCGN